MSAVTGRTVITTRHEYVISSPAARSDIEAAIAWALSDMPEDRRSYDDACWVEARDDDVVVWWAEVPKAGPR